MSKKEAYRLGKNTTAMYTSFEELANAYGLKPIVKRTKDKNKLESQREKFLKNKICKACKTPMVYNSGTNILSCNNPDCKGIKHESKDVDTGTTKIWYTPSYMILDETGTSIAENLFD